jgi:hypothetical protein
MTFSARAFHQEIYCSGHNPLPPKLLDNPVLTVVLVPDVPKPSPMIVVRPAIVRCTRPCLRGVSTPSTAGIPGRGPIGSNGSSAVPGAGVNISTSASKAVDEAVKRVSSESQLRRRGLARHSVRHLGCMSFSCPAVSQCCEISDGSISPLLSRYYFAESNWRWCGDVRRRDSAAAPSRT